MKISFLTAAVLLVLSGAARAAGTISLVPAGAVEVRTGRGDWQAVSRPQDLQAGQEVRTHGDSTALLVFSDGSRVQLGNSAIFSVDRTDKKEASFSLKFGKLKAAFAGLLSSRVVIHTPSAVAAVRGTVFELGADAKGGTEIAMAEGVLEVKDNNGKQAVVTSEETLKVDEKGLGHPHMLSLDDSRSLSAVRPYAVHQEMARDATRKMLEDIRNRELKAGEAQLGKDVVDAFGRRVRLEEYLLRPDTKSFEVLFLNYRKDSFNWGHFVETFNSAIPTDLSQVPAIISAANLSATQPTNWLKNFEFYATNTVDAEKETIAFGAPVKIDFSGFGKGQLWYPSSQDFVQTLYGPGVPGGSRVEFSQHQDWNSTVSGQFTWWQKVQATPGTNDLQNMLIASLDPTKSADVAAGYTRLTTDPVLYPGTNTTTLFPGGPNKADIQQSTLYPDGSSLTVEKFLVSNEGQILDFRNASADTFTNNGSYNLEINLKSSLFQGRAIDVLMAPEILQQKATGTSVGSNIH